MSNHTTLHINCQANEKNAWMLTARAHGISFEQWVLRTLNSATVDTNPEWLHGLSERARLCILSTGFNSRNELLAAIGEGFDISTISNLGGSAKTEVEQWIK